MLDTPFASGEPPAVAEARELTISLPGRDLKARLYVPQHTRAPLPLCLFYHGGGWVLGTLDTHDATCRALARASGAALLSVAYRLAPENPYPAALDDCYESLLWATGSAELPGVDRNRICVAGDSAGANLAAATNIMARDRGSVRLKHQLLIYPVTDADFTRPSYAENGGGEFFLSTEMMRWYWRQYLGGLSHGEAPLAAILKAGDLSGLSPATIITAEYDPLRDEGLAYAQRLRQAGVPVEVHVAPGMIHGFFSMFEAVPESLEWINKAGSSMREALLA